MIEEKQEAYLFIGGLKDGEWHNVPVVSRQWAFPYIKFEPIKNGPEDFGWQERGDIVYKRYCIAHKGRENLYIFVEQSLLNSMNLDYFWDIMCKLVNNYKVIK